MNKKILVVDDEEYLVILLKDNLEFDGFTVYEAYNGEEALQRTYERKPDLIVLDIGMPKLDGWEVCRRLKENPATSHIPIIILSALTQDEDMEKGRRLGAIRYFKKPCDPVYIINAVKEILKVT
ncbi:MAG: response regulator [Elusimicrobiota bacterium]